MKERNAASPRHGRTRIDLKRGRFPFRSILGRGGSLFLAAVVAILVLYLPARGPTFAQSAGPRPWPTSWNAYRMASDVPITDAPGTSNPSRADLVGSETYPLGYLAFDGINLFFRLRINATPLSTTGQAIGHFTGDTAYSLLIETDQNTSNSYEHGIIFNGDTNNQVQVWRNTSPTGSWTDNPETKITLNPTLDVTYTGSGSRNDPYVFVDPTWARGFKTSLVESPTSSFDSDDDYFVDIQIPLSVLTAASGGTITADTPIRLVFATSQNANNFNKDFGARAGFATLNDYLAAASLTSIRAGGAIATPTNTSTWTPTSTPTSTPTWTPTATSTPTDTPLPTNTPTAVPTATATQVLTQTPTGIATATSTSGPTQTPTVSPTGSPVATSTAIPTATSSQVPTPTPTGIATATASPTGVPAATSTSSPIPSATATAGGVATATSTPATPPALTPTASPVPGVSATATAISSATSSPAATQEPATQTPTATSAPGTSLGTLSGTVTDSASGAALAGVSIQVSDSTGNAVRSGLTDAGGRYSLSGLPVGS